MNREKDPLHQICMQELHCQVPSIAGHGLSYWLWYHSLLVGQRECISSEHFSEGFLSRTWAEYLVVLVQPMPHNQCQSTQLWGLQHLWLANEISLLAHNRVSNWPEPGQRGAVGICMSQPSRTYRLTNMQLNWPSVTSLWWKHLCLVSSVISSQESDGLA